LGELLRCQLAQELWGRSVLYSQRQAILVLSDKFANVLAAGAVALLIDLLVDEVLERVGQGNAHCGHGEV
jgi:hypothetical protein